MKYNNRIATEKFNREWAQLEKEYRAAGMSETAIQEMRAFDWDLKKKERIFCWHNQYLPDLSVEDLDMDIEMSPLYKKFIEVLAVETEYFAEGDQWIDAVEDVKLAIGLKSLTEKQKMIMRLVYVEEYNQLTVANIMGVSEAMISKQMKAIKKKIKKFY